MVDVVAAAWTGAGQPEHAERTLPGTCARCGMSTLVAPLTAAVSRNFTGFDGWLNPGAGGLCAACVWAYQTRDLRHSPYLIERSPSRLMKLAPAGLGRLLTAGPLPVDRALAVPLRPGRKHLLPAARWGLVRVDDALLPWTGDDAGLLAITARLRAAGFGSRMLGEPAPPYAVLRRQPRAEWTRIVEEWRALDGWRRRPQWLSLGLVATASSAASSSASSREAAA